MAKTKKKTKQKTDWMPKSEEERVTLWKTRKDASVRYMRERFTKNADRWRDFYKGLHWESQTFPIPLNNGSYTPLSGDLPGWMPNILCLGKS